MRFLTGKHLSRRTLLRGAGAEDVLVFAGGMEGNFFALDAKTGERLWNVGLGGPNASGPISYAVDGKQYIVGTGQGTMYVFALPD